MKEIIALNQRKLVESGLYNIPKVIILETLMTHPVREFRGDKFTLSRDDVMDELPLLNLSSTSLRNYYMSLDEEGFIEYTKDGRDDLFKVTPKGVSVFYGEFIRETPVKEPSELTEQEKNLIKLVGKVQFKVLMENKDYFARLEGKKGLFITWLQHRNNPGLKAPCRNFNTMKAQASYFFNNDVETIKKAMKIATSSGKAGWIDIKYGFQEVEKIMDKEEKIEYTIPS